MRVLVACEMSGRVRDAFTARGHWAMSCDMQDSLTPGRHYRGDVRDLLGQSWDLVIGFPPCTDLSSANSSKLAEKIADGRSKAAYDLFAAIYEAGHRCAVENPVGIIPTFFRKADQIIDPWQFGDPYFKRTCLWLRGLPKLIPTHERPADVQYWHSGSGYNSGHRHGNAMARTARERGLTFPGVARAMAEQWG